MPLSICPWKKLLYALVLMEVHYNSALIAVDLIGILFHQFRPHPCPQKNTYTAHWPGLPALFKLSSYVASHCLTLSPQSGAKSFIVLFTT
jgi:hypothetical protein